MKKSKILIMFISLLLLSLSSIAQNNKNKELTSPLTNKGEIILWNFVDKMVGFEVKWQVAPMGIDTWKPQPSADQAVQNSTTIVQGLFNTKHTLELILNGDGQIPLKAIRVYSPPLK